jgi:hypothetical protein
MNKWVFIRDFYHIKEGTLIDDDGLRKIAQDVYDMKLQTGINNSRFLLDSLIPLAEWRDKQIDRILND